MTSPQQPGARPAKKRQSRKWWPVAGLMLGLVGSAALAMSVPSIYESSTSVLVIPQRVPDDFVRSTVTAVLGERLNIISQQILSRTRLERVVQEFNLYERERQQMIMEDVVERMRRDISLNLNVPKNGEAAAASFHVGFRSPDPRTAMRVTERLASLFVQENIEDRALLADQTVQFMQTQLEEIRRRLQENELSLLAWDRQAAGRPRPQDLVAQNDALLEHYKSTMRKHQDAEMAVNMERRQIGEQFKVIDGARFPERPVSPDRVLFIFRGALIGLMASFALMLLSTLWRRRVRHNAP